MATRSRNAVPKLKEENRTDIKELREIDAALHPRREIELRGTVAALHLMISTKSRETVVVLCPRRDVDPKHRLCFLVL